jgi:hypothetical protein
MSYLYLFVNTAKAASLPDTFPDAATQASRAQHRASDPASRCDRSDLWRVDLDESARRSGWEIGDRGELRMPGLFVAGKGYVSG